ncbi:mannosyltransferase family protein [Streptomyces sp. NBC_01363]|uniref:mannosyltransferase family protein n=1 Tax=Streptomyces sp. NBC_01363 TaxID=2903840 RepID=UPI002258B9DE|nr:mannosyltransferase family protein [Streptomyces sp. NBC_01363]MCX4730741.1 mannosyltransferase family protein [Streptomyces sp. NBC_01363]
MLLRIGPADREVLWLYLLTRVGIWTIAYCTRWMFPDEPGTHHAASFFSSWQRWDWWHYLHIAQQGYFPGQSGPWTSGWDNREAFFPGFPFLLRAVHTVVPSWPAAGALISLVAGGVAVLALARIARLHLPQAEAGQRAALFFLLSPCAVFLAVGYTEALFLALALPAWLAAQRLNWPLAAVLTCLATTVRVSGLFLAAALAVHFLMTARTPAHWRRLPWLALPALPPFLYSWYLHAHTSDWMAWKHAEERGWYRDFHAPWEAWKNTWHAAFGHSQATGYALMCQAELLTMLVGIVLCGLLVRRRRWAEAAYIALSLWALGTSYWYTSIPRATLLWWPLWTGLAAWSLRSPRVKTAYLAVAAPLMTVFAVTFLSGRWAG